MQKFVPLFVFLPLSLTSAPTTFSRDVAPIFYQHCVTCHRPNNIAPMSLIEYKSARPWAKSIRESVLKRKMPPWFADPRFGHFSNDARLSEKEIELIKSWVDGGSPEGDPKDLPSAPNFADGWQIGKPDIIIDIGEDHKVIPGEDSYDHFLVETHFKEGKWIRAAEIKPGNRRVVHHVHVLLVQNDPAKMEAASTQNMPSLQQFLIKEGKLTRIRQDAPVVNDACDPNAPNLPFLHGFQEGGLAAFLPGRPPDLFPDGTAKWIPPGAKLEFVIHYAKIPGQVQTDRTSVGLYLAPEPPKIPLRRMDLRNFFFRIPAGAPSHEVKRCYTFEKDTLLLSFTPHMHYRGKDITYDLIHSNGTRETLLAVPRYDFNWQLVYRLRDPVRVEKGATLVVTAHYDNSPNNRANPDPAKAIRWGDKSEEEMMTSWIEFLEPRLPAVAGAGRR
ncbi:MAG: cytochrome c [Bryobacterales bacterium]|nr:cytochrome c [Bryobacterales bacterium]